MPSNTFTLEEAYGNPTEKQDFPELVPAKRTNPTSAGETFLPGSDQDNPLPKDPGLFNIIKAAADKYNVPEEYAFALAQQESGYDPNVENDIGAKGLYQYIDATSKALGIDPFNPTASADAAMKDFAQQAKTKGIDWAIKHHFAGPNEKLHGPKTQEYLASVKRRAETIAKALGRDGIASNLIGQEIPDEENSQTLKSVKPGQKFSLEEAYGPVGMGTAGQTKEAGFNLKEDIVDPVIQAGKHLFSSIQDRLNNPPQKVERSPEEINVLVDEAMKHLPDAPNPFGFAPTSPTAQAATRKDLQEKFRFTNPMSSEQEAQDFQVNQTKRQAQELAQYEQTKNLPPWQQFVQTLKNPIKAILEDSLPANIASIIHNAPVKERLKYDELKQILQRQKILTNPSDYPAEVVSAARQKEDEIRNKQNPTIRAQWDALKESALDHPGSFAANLVNSIMADPEMLLAPIGTGGKAIQSLRAEQTGSKVIQLADKILDTGAVGATLNTTIDLADQLAHSTHVDSKELAFSGAAGTILGGSLGAIFSRGAKSKITDLNKAKANGKFEEVLHDQAAYESEIERIVSETSPEAFGVTSDVKQRIEAALGITNKTDRRKWINQRREDVRAAFKSAEDYADFQQFKAEERITRTEQLAAEQASREAAAAKQQAESDAAGFTTLSPQTPAGPSPGEVYRVLRKPGHLRTAEDKLILRDIPKGQRGEVDQKLLARLAVGGSFAAAGYAAAPEDRKIQTAFVSGLAGLMVPGGGSVLRRMAQSGATTLEGDIVSIARLVKDGKLKIGRDASEQMIREKALIDKAKQGDQKAYTELYEENFPRISRYINKQIKGVASRLGITSDDVAQEAFIDAFNQLNKFSGDVPFSAYLTRIAKNKAVDAIRDAQTLKGGKDISTGSMYAADRGLGEDASAGHITEGDNPLVRPDVEAAAADDFDTPEMQAVRQETEGQLINLIDKLPEKQKRALLLNRVEQYSTEEVAKLMGESPENARKLISRAQDFITEGLEKGYGAKKAIAQKPVVSSAEDIPLKRGRGRPRKQVGEVDPRLLKLGAVAALGVGAASFLSTENKKLAGTITALGGLGLLSRGRGGESLARGLVDTIDHGLGAVSTRLMNISRPLWWKTIEHYRSVLRDTHKYMKEADPFLVKLENLPKDQKDFISRAILTGHKGVVQRMIEAMGDTELLAGWKKVQGVLDSIGDQLVHLKRFKNKEVDYFPRIVTDYPGLLKALGNDKADFLNKIVDDANKNAIRSRGTELTELERSLIINKALMSEPKLGGQPGFAKDRTVKEITPELQKFYATPTESLHSYIRSAVEDIERAKFFGKDLEVIEKDGKEYTNVDKSVGKLVDSMLQSGKITEKQAMDVSSMMKSLFLNGERPSNEIVQKAKNLSYAGLLGNPISAVSQLGDAVIQTYIQGVKSAISGVVKSITGKKFVSMKEFGLADHLAEEFVNTEGTAKFLRRVFKVGLFSQLDALGKNVGLNAAISKAASLTKTEGGIAKLHEKYGDVLQPQEFKQLVNDLQKGEVTDLVRSVAFAELSRTQPITRLEMPQAYLDNPNGRLLYQFKTFMLKQMDVFRRDAYNEIKKGNVAKGIKNLVSFATVLGISGASTSQIQNWIRGRDSDLKASDIPLNALKTFGMSEYILDHMMGVSKEEAEARRDAGEAGARTTKAEPLQTVAGMIMPPAKMFDEIVRADPNALRYIPIVGPTLLENYKKQKAEEAP